ncbi:MAG: contractile injection system protein, VgrG/Pvc8 family [Ruegeria sp.]|uniref:contractile injection system protein, VgrG/Pvc8 family n=1 Tax=Ruegeria sp. TaxID=1879320 RepID=UPI00349EF6CE
MQVDYRIVADGIDITERFQKRLVSLVINDEAGSKSDTAEIKVDDRDHAIDLPPTGATLQIAIGFVGDLVEIGSYVVDELAGDISPATMTIRAKSADMLSGIRARKTRAWPDSSIERIAGTIAGEHGLKPVISDSLKSKLFGYLAQTSESDLNFLTRIARDLDAVAKPAGGALLFVKRGKGKSADGSSLPVYRVNRTDISRGSWQINGRGRYGSVVAEWGERGTATVHKVQIGRDDPKLILRHRHPNEAEARRAAEAALDRSHRASGTIDIQLGGFWGDLLAEGKVDLRGIKPELEGEWLITRVQHRLSRTLTTSFEAERDNEKAQSE